MRKEPKYQERPCYVCDDRSNHELILIIDKKPGRETEFNIPENEYLREIYQCKSCGVYNDFHAYNFDELYKGFYNEMTYNNDILSKYQKIMAFPFEESDNKQRVERISNHLKERDVELEGLEILDVGSGLGVFIGEFSKRGVNGYCLDPDPISAKHAVDNACATEAYCGSLLEVEIDKKFDLITLNKVLEHVENPVAFLGYCKTLLKKDGLIYIELPESEGAIKALGIFEQEEFFIEHYTIFNEQSIQKTVALADMQSDTVTSIKEPSGKFSVYCFARN